MATGLLGRSKRLVDLVPCALLVSIAVAASTSLQAVQLSQHGLGQVLLYPYYTTRTIPKGGPYNTLFIVTNTSSDTKVLRIRFRESKNGRTVASVNVYLVPNDSWAAGIVPTDSGGAQLLWYDQSCTEPAVAIVPATLPFSDSQFTGTNSDFEDDSISRTEEGYFEILELGVVKDLGVLAALKPDRTQPNVVPDCSTALATSLDDASKIGPPSGGLMGSAFLVNVLAGAMYSYEATALDDFSHVPLWSRPSASGPTLEDVNPKVSRIFDGAVLRQNSWDVTKGARPADAVSAVLMQDQVLNYFVLDSGTASGTDWIVTMPTKPYYVSVVGAYAPPPSLFASSFAKGGAPDSFGSFPPCAPIVAPLEYDREGQGQLPPSGCLGVPPPTLPFDLPWTSNVITLNESYVLAAIASVDWRLGDPSRIVQNGWARIGPAPNPSPSMTHKLVSTDSPPTTYYGLPMIGLMVNSYYNGAIPTAQGNLLSAYGATAPHKGIVRIE